MKVYFLRHGQTNYNVLGLCNDTPTTDVRLTALGRAQAAAAAALLRGVRLDRILTSELPRTRETADIVNREHGVAIAPHPDLNDWRTGLDGRPVAELYTAIARDPLHTRLDGGETLAEHRARVYRFLDELRTGPEGAVLVVAHEETLRAAAAYFRRLSDEAMLALRFRNGELLEFDLSPD
jgi:broad specificity phosphatase PhoE